MNKHNSKIKLQETSNKCSTFRKNYSTISFYPYICGYLET